MYETGRHRYHIAARVVSRPVRLEQRRTVVMTLPLSTAAPGRKSLPRGPAPRLAPGVGALPLRTAYENLPPRLGTRGNGEPTPHFPRAVDRGSHAAPRRALRTVDPTRKAGR